MLINPMERPLAEADPKSPKQSRTKSAASMTGWN